MELSEKLIKVLNQYNYKKNMLFIIILLRFFNVIICI